MRRLFNVKCLIFNLILLYTLHLTHYTSFAQQVSSTELIQNAKEYDGKDVVYRGEAIGDIMPRNGFAWINVNDGKNAVGIWLDKNLLKDVFYTGSYKSHGDILEIEGRFHRSCPEHGGDLDIHAQALRKVESGMETPDNLNIFKRNLTFILLGVLCLVLILSLLKRK